MTTDTAEPNVLDPEPSKADVERFFREHECRLEWIETAIRINQTFAFWEPE